MYVLGLLKLPFLSPCGPGQKAIVTLDALDSMSYQRYALNQMSPEEILPLLNPWVMNIHDFQLSSEQLPALEALDRTILQKNQLLLAFNGFQVLLYVGKACDPWFLNELFGVSEFKEVNKHLTEEEIFVNTETSAYQYALYTLINGQLRVQRQPFCELKVLLEGDPEADAALKALLITDSVANPSYNVDFVKFQQTILG